MTGRPFPPSVNFHALSLRDLLDAREAYHVHLAHLDNVVATAVGLYRIRKADLENNPQWATGPGLAARPGDKGAKPVTPPRTLQNSVIVPESWPCVMVFVRDWQQIDDFRNNPDQVVPKRLYLPDGRTVPACVVLATINDAPPMPARRLNLTPDLLGGGVLCFSEIQGEQLLGSIACLVSDGLALYALTNRHVAGKPGQEVSSMLRGEATPLGVTQDAQVGKRPFEEVYPGWPGQRSVVNVDAALIGIEDRDSWTAQVFGVGEIGEPVDLNTDTISLQLIGTPVRAYGGASGDLTGEIQALYYRYKSIGGLDYIADMLIGPRSDGAPVNTHRGDSGSLWFYDPPPAKEALEDDVREAEHGLRAPRLRPLALQWGGHRLLGTAGDEQLQFALATSLSTVCRALDVELVRGWNIGFSEYWGKVGHYKVAATACDLPTIDECRSLFVQNRDRVSFDDAAIGTGRLRRIDNQRFVPLADVADLVWRTTRRADASNHFADMDQKGGGRRFKNTTLLELCEDPKNVAVDVWNEFYESIDADKRGALPFRVWQIYDDMVASLKAGDVVRFLCGGGLMAHYVGDACQPLHVSHFHHGRTPAEKAVHSDYETKMLDRKAVEVLAGVNARAADFEVKSFAGGGHRAAVEVVKLMSSTVEKLPPEEVVEVWADTKGRRHIDDLWDALGERTCERLASGAACLASIWQSAWEEGDGEDVSAAVIAPIDRPKLRALYMDKDYLPAVRLQDLVLERPAVRAGRGGRRAPRHR